MKNKKMIYILFLRIFPTREYYTVLTQTKTKKKQAQPKLYSKSHMILNFPRFI